MTPTTTIATSPRKIEANRANALHSTGPRTDAGKSAASHNAISHGLTSRSALLPGEDPDLYFAHREVYYQTFQPTTGLQLEMVEELASIEWRLHRVPAFEAQLLNLEIERLDANHEDEPYWDFADGNPGRIAALAFKRLVDSKVLSNLHSLENRLTRRAERIHKFLQASYGAAVTITSAPPPIEDLQIEPNHCHLETVEPPPPPTSTSTTITNVKIGRNEPCPCGSTLKFKRCCIGKAQIATASAARPATVAAAA